MVLYVALETWTKVLKVNIRSSNGQKTDVCLSESYAGQCDRDDGACAQACIADQLECGKCSGKCGNFRNTTLRVCYCKGCEAVTAKFIEREKQAPDVHPTVQNGVDTPWCGDIVELIIDHAIKEECWQKCEEVPECKGAHYYARGRQCWLKARMDCAKGPGGYDSWDYIKGTLPGPYPVVELGMDYPCGDVTKIEYVQTQEECWSKCDAVSRWCIVASYGDKTCWLKSQKNVGVRSAGTVSYIRRDETGHGGSCIY
ncbi:hypothetical protein BV898_19053 [Hypsibius exemplaris]|uniref:Apple domain-containing protein n=1 Tax=Hypsibius exemplaris TaxID=2072580 RepID=A0A9X6NRF0_HYPEX|nr:hypothetical protein BV898_19053 [Hypsibius exemplaris]